MASAPLCLGKTDPEGPWHVFPGDYQESLCGGVPLEDCVRRRRVGAAGDARAVKDPLCGRCLRRLVRMAAAAEALTSRGGVPAVGNANLDPPVRPKRGAAGLGQPSGAKHKPIKEMSTMSIAQSGPHYKAPERTQQPTDAENRCAAADPYDLLLAQTAAVIRTILEWSDGAVSRSAEGDDDDERAGA